MNFANRINKIQPSQTLAITALVDKLRRQGRDIIDLGAGEPDFDTPEVVKQAAIQAIHDGFTKYTPASGILELKEAICDKLRNENDLDYRPTEIIVTCGAKHAVFNALLALCQEGDEVILPTPYWTSYLEQINFVGAKPILLKADDRTDFKITTDQLREVITPRTRMLIMNSPSNPTGAVYSRSEQQELAELIEKSGILVLTDEIYEKIIYDGEEHVSLPALADLKDRAIVVNGASKAFAMTGWRIGYLAADERVAKAIMKVQSHSTSNPCSISQKASLAALQAGDAIINEMVQAFKERRDYLFEAVQRIPGFDCVLPKGAFYMFVNISELFGRPFEGKKMNGSMELCSFLLEKAAVAIVPGEAFGSKNHVRISYATSLDNLKQAVDSIHSALRADSKITSHFCRS